MKSDQLLLMIEQAVQEKATTLDLMNNQLTKLPPEIGQLSNLEQLNLSGNQLTELPPEITQLSNLPSLNLSRNQLTELPPEIGQLSNLQSLYLNSNQLTELPPEIGQLSNLLSLYLRNNQLTELPPEIWQLSNLLELFLSENLLPVSDEFLDLATTPAIIRYYFDEPTFSAFQVKRSIEFPPEFKEAAVSILSYFNHILTTKYPDMDIGVTIEQRDNMVTLIIDTPDGQRETIERELNEYRLVVTRQLAPEEYLSDPFEVVRLKHKLELAEMETRQVRELLYTERKQYDARINTHEEQIKMLSNILDKDRYANTELVSLLGKLSSEATESNRKSLDTIIGIVERGVSEDDKSAIIEELASIRNDDQSLFNKVKELLMKGAIQGTAGNYLYSILQYLSHL